MLILTAENITDKKKRLAVRGDGTADYDVWVGINQVCIWHGKIKRHTRQAGAAPLLRMIADEIDKHTIGDDGDVETLCEHGVGHGQNVHTCDGCCFKKKNGRKRNR